MRIPLLSVAASSLLSGCVVGSGACLFEQPFKHTITGTVHFQDFPAGEEQIDHVPVLTVDKTAYIYAPATSLHCLPATELQLVGFSELPPDMAEGAHVEVTGSVFQAASVHQHTAFLIDVKGILPMPSASNPGAGMNPGPNANPGPKANPSAAPTPGAASSPGAAPNPNSPP